MGITQLPCKHSEQPVAPKRNQLSYNHGAGAFVTPISSKNLFNATSRRAVSRTTCPPNGPPRRTLVMKKVRRGAVNDESNAVDVFGGAGLSQDELLAAALGDSPGVVEEAPTKQKKKKDKKKKGAVDEDENAVDVFAGINLSQDELLANALGDSDNVGKPIIKKKGKKKSAPNTDSNAVDVFGNAGKSQEELLAEALGDSSPVQETKKKKKKGKKKQIADDESTAVDVFGNVGKSQEDLLSESLGELSTQPSTADISVGDKPLQALEEKGADCPVLSDTLSSDEEDDDSTAGDVDSQDEVTEKEVEVEVEDDFEVESEVVAEFEKSSEEFLDFTRVGRRQKSRSKRSERNNAESHLTDPKRANFGSGGEKYTSVRFEDVTMTFRNSTILNGVTWGVQTGERVGLIGENGCGKTTQLRMIAGLIDPTSGEIVRSSERTKASFLRQEFIDELDPTRTLREEFFSAFEEEGKFLEQYKQCEADIANAGEDLERLEVLLNEMEEVRVKCEERDAWNLDSRIDKVMPGLGFTEEDNDKLVASYSGGWKVRIGLGKVLLQDPDLLLLDEPSNHLDTESVEWLEQYLQTCKLPMIVVSHDREFLDRVCTKMVEVEGGEAFEYPGNYSTFVKLKKEQRAAWEAAYAKQQKFIKEQQVYIKRNRRSPARSSQVKSREKMLERMERTGQMVRRPPRQGKPLVFRFPPAPRSGRDCIVIEDMSHGYSGCSLFKDASLTVERGDRIALVGPNGSGKSTLLRMITGSEKPSSGTVECEDLTNISLAYYEQNQADALDLNKTVLDTLKHSAPGDMRYEEIRALLGKFLFKGDDVDKKVSALSGGEKARLALAKIMLEPSNVLVLDEPGNHLSISAKEMLEEALQQFDGTLLLVSHDRYLISQVATQIVAVEDRQLELYDGDYKSYMEKNQELKERVQARFIPGVAEIKSAPKVVIEEPMALVDKKVKRKRSFGGNGVQSGKTKEMNAKRWNRR